MTQEITTYRCPSPIGDLYVSVQNNMLTHISITPTDNFVERRNNFTQQLTEYFNGQRQTFSLPLNPDGTKFQQMVWQALLDIPYGKTATYKQIAEHIGRPTACRAVGNAIHHNPLPIVIPCHRVVGSNGKLTGFALGLDTKKILLHIEGVKND